MFISIQSLGGGGMEVHTVAFRAPDLDEGLRLERSCRWVHELFAMGTWKTQVQRMNYNTGLG